MPQTPKTNAVRIIETAGIRFRPVFYEVDERHLDAVTVAGIIGVESERVWKTIVMEDGKKNCFVFCVPAPCEVDAKKAAAVCGSGKLEPVKLSELFAVTGYIRGGCSPVGMKKSFPTVIDEVALAFETIFVSGGTRGLQIELSPRALAGLIEARFADITRW